MAGRRTFAMLVTLAPAVWGCVPDLGFPARPAPVSPGGETPDETDDGGDTPAAENPYWCCDPDEPRCTCQGPWRCTEGVSGAVCRQANPTLPDEGGASAWSCTYNEQQIVCTGAAADHPEAGSGDGWVCTEEAGTIACTRTATGDDFPGAGGDTPWDCSYSSRAEVRACEEVHDDGSEEGGWSCTVRADGRTECANENPGRPDDGEWTCLRVNGQDVCEGDHFPDDGTGWSCAQEAEIVRCTSDQGQLPDDGGGISWDCSWDHATLNCVDLPDDGGGSAPGDEGDGGGDGADDGGGTGGDGGGDGICLCVVGTTRTCDEPEYCLFGEQTCQDNGGDHRWGTCTETPILNGCEPGGAHAEDYSWRYVGGYWDRDDQREQDEDGDGRILTSPDWWYNPAGQDCAMRQGRCVQDMWDFDVDGDNQESTGDCGDLQECR